MSSSDGDVVDPNVIEKALSGHAMYTKIVNAEALTTHYCADFFEHLGSVRKCDFGYKNSTITVKLLLKLLAPRALQLEMTRRLQYDEALEKNVKLFIITLTCEAVKCQAYATQERENEDTTPCQTGKKPDKKGKHPSQYKELTTGEKNENEFPLCLWEDH